MQRQHTHVGATLLAYAPNLADAASRTRWEEYALQCQDVAGGIDSISENHLAVFGGSTRVAFRNVRWVPLRSIRCGNPLLCGCGPGEV